MTDKEKGGDAQSYNRKMLHMMITMGMFLKKLQLKVLGKLVCIMEQVKEFYFMMWQHQFSLEDLKSKGRIRDKLERHLRKHFRN